MAAFQVFCAFCASPFIPTTLLPPRSYSAQSFATRYVTPRIRRARHALPIQPPKRQRVSDTPRAVFNNNQNDNRLKTNAADFILQAGRFLQSPPGQVVVWGGLVWLVLTGRIGALFDSFLILFAVISVVPVLAMVGFRWWVKRQIVEGVCPSCGATVTGLRGQAFQCSVCGNTMQGEKKGNFSVKDPSKATIDIDAKEIDEY